MVPLWSATVGAETAPLVVLIHGSMDRSTGLLKLSRQLDDECQVLRYDRRGYGRSTMSDGTHPGPFDMTAQVDDLLMLLDGRAAILVGHSYGGNVALALAARAPQQVPALAVYETPLSWEPWWPGSTAGAQAVGLSHDSGLAAERFMRGLVGDAVWESLPERTRATRRLEGAAMVGELGDLRQHRPWTAEAIACPVRVGVGSLGRPHHQHGMTALHDMLPTSSLETLEGCRHDAPLSHPQLFADMLVRPLLRLALS